jgi:hypothetical protein
MMPSVRSAATSATALGASFSGMSSVSVMATDYRVAADNLAS